MLQQFYTMIAIKKRHRCHFFWIFTSNHGKKEVEDIVPTGDLPSGGIWCIFGIFLLVLVMTKKMKNQA
jgi:hypothetical protein